MALWLTVVIALTCLGGLASPGPAPPSTRRELKELIEELVNITQNQVSLALWVLGWELSGRVLGHGLGLKVGLSQEAYGAGRSPMDQDSPNHEGEELGRGLGEQHNGWPIKRCGRAPNWDHLFPVLRPACQDQLLLRHS